MVGGGPDHVRRIELAVNLFRSERERIGSEKAMRGFLAGLCLTNVIFLRLHPDCPGLYQSGVVYKREPPGEEVWQDIPTMLRTMNGDCEDLACWRVAELRVKHGIRAKPHLSYRKDGHIYKYHVTVKLPNGQIEDPSRRLGM
jgi:hypothetical protein